MNNKIKKLRWIKLLIGLVFVLGIIGIMVYPFENRNLKIEIITKQANYVINKSNTDVINEENTVLEFSGIKKIELDYIRIYGNFDSMYLKKMDHNEMTNYVETVSNGLMQWSNETLLFEGNGDMSVIFNKAFQEILREQSASFLQERLLLSEILFIFCAIMLMGCKIIEEKINGDNHGPIYEVRKFVGDLKKYGQYMIYAARTDLRAEVANSYLNRLWWLLEPLFSMLVYVIVFGQVMGRSVDNYGTYIFSTLLMWSFFNKTINYSVKLVRNNRDIVSKVYVPKFILLLSNMALNLFKLLFSMIILVVMLVIFKVEIGLNILWVIPAYIGLVLLAFGVGMIFLHYGVYVDDLAYAVGILLNMLMYLSGVFYEVMTTLPEPLNVFMMCLNPVAMYLDTMRNALLYNSLTNLPILIIWIIISLIFCCIGVHIVYKNENGYVKVV